jgi:hypothetical protein
MPMRTTAMISGREGQEGQEGHEGQEGQEGQEGGMVYHAAIQATAISRNTMPMTDNVRLAFVERTEYAASRRAESVSAPEDGA